MYLQSFLNTKMSFQERILSSGEIDSNSKTMVLSIYRIFCMLAVSFRLFRITI